MPVSGAPRQPFYPATSILVPVAADLRVLAKYPFVGEAARYARDRGIELADLLSSRTYDRVRALGIDRVRSALEEGVVPDRAAVGEAEALAELLSYPVARIVASCIADPYLNRRYAIAEAKRAHGRMAIEEAEFLEFLARELDVDLRREDGADRTFRVHFTDFLKHTRSMRDPGWKLINQPVDRGYVVLPRDKAVRLLQNAVQGRIESELPLPVNDEILATFRPQTVELKALLAQKKERFKAQELGKVSITRFPPCMYNILAAIQNHENVAHQGRFAIVAFLHHIGLSNDEIFRVFGDVPDFAADVTRYQIDHITGTISPTEYTPPECSTMQSYGLCPGGDALCHEPWMHHPLTYYRRKPTWLKGAAKSAPPAGPP